jgi:DNA repair protein RadC
MKRSTEGPERDGQDWQERVAGHRQRLRDKFLKQGLSAFSDLEVLELLLSLGTPRQDCKDRAKKILKRFGSLPVVLEASVAELQEVPGIGPKNAFAVKLIHEVARKFLREKVQGKTYVKAAADVVKYLWHSLSHRKREVFVVVFLDAQHAIIEVEDLFEGTLTSSAVYPREVLRRSLDHHAAALVLAHNHPSGSNRPSKDDKALTLRLYTAAKLFDIEVLDHIIIGEAGSYYSFADEGVMEQIRSQAGQGLSGDVRR